MLVPANQCRVLLLPEQHLLLRNHLQWFRSTYRSPSTGPVPCKRHQIHSVGIEHPMCQNPLSPKARHCPLKCSLGTLLSCFSVFDASGPRFTMSFLIFFACSLSPCSILNCVSFSLSLPLLNGKMSQRDTAGK